MRRPLKLFLVALFGTSLLIGGAPTARAAGPWYAAVLSVPVRVCQKNPEHPQCKQATPSSQPAPTQPPATATSTAMPTVSPAPTFTPTPTASPTPRPTPTSSPSPFPVASATPSPQPDRAVIDGNGREQLEIIRATSVTRNRYDYLDAAPRQNGAVIVYDGASATFTDSTFTDIRSQRNSDGSFKTDANDHILYPGANVGTVIVRNSYLDASALNGAAFHAYPASSAGAKYIELTDVEIKVGDMNYWGIFVSRAERLVLRNVTITGPVRTPASAAKYGFANLYGKAIEIYGMTSAQVTMENVRWNGQLLTFADTQK